MEFPTPLGNRIPSQLLPFRVFTLFSPSEALQIGKFKCNFAFLSRWYSMAGYVSELGCEANWSGMQTSWNPEIMRPEGSSQEFRVHSNYFDLCSLFWASLFPEHSLFHLTLTIHLQGRHYSLLSDGETGAQSSHCTMQGHTAAK